VFVAPVGKCSGADETVKTFSERKTEGDSF